MVPDAAEDGVLSGVKAQRPTATLPSRIGRAGWGRRRGWFQVEGRFTLLVNSGNQNSREEYGPANLSGLRFHRTVAQQDTNAKQKCSDCLRELGSPLLFGVQSQGRSGKEVYWLPSPISTPGISPKLQLLSPGLRAKPRNVQCVPVPVTISSSFRGAGTVGPTPGSP